MSATEITEVRALPPPGQVVRAFAIDTPVAGEQTETDGFVLAGWALGETEPIQTITVSESGRTLTELPVNSRRPDVAAAHPSTAQAEQTGFHGWVPTVGLGPTFMLEIHAVSAGNRQAALGTIAGRRNQPAASRPQPRPTAADLPQFFIIGTQRGGTRSLYEYLAAHPGVQPATTEEVHFFSLFFDRGLRWFQSQFPPSRADQITGEASPYYLFHPLAPERMHAVVPDAKLIVLLRDPVDRALSHYQLEVRQGNEPLSFEDAIAAEADRLAGEEQRIRDDDTYASFAHQHYSYLARGRYVEQLRRWLSRFPREQLLILKSEDFYRDPAAVYRRTTDFLGLAPAPLESAPIFNESTPEPMDPATRARLRAYFQRENAALADLVGVDITWPASPDQGSGQPAPGGALT